MEQIIMFRVLHFTKKYGKILRTVKVLPYADNLILFRGGKTSQQIIQGGKYGNFRRIIFCHRKKSHSIHIADQNNLLSEC